MKILRGSLVFDPSIFSLGRAGLSEVIDHILEMLRSGLCRFYIAEHPFISNAKYISGSTIDVFRFSFSQGSLIVYCEDDSLYNGLDSYNGATVLNEDTWADVRVFVGGRLHADSSCQGFQFASWINDIARSFDLGSRDTSQLINLYCLTESSNLDLDSISYRGKALITPGFSGGGNCLGWVEYGITRSGLWGSLNTLLEGQKLVCMEEYELTGLENIEPIAVSVPGRKPLIYSIGGDIVILSCTPKPISPNMPAIKTILLYMSTEDEKRLRQPESF